MSKRQKFVLVTSVLLVGIIASRVGLGQFLQWRFRVIVFVVAALMMSIWAIKDEDFGGVEWFTLPILPTMFSIGALLAFPLLSETIGEGGDSGLLLGTALKMVFLGIFVVGYYASLLTANIYNVAAIRTIQLLRVAHSIGFLVTVATALLLYVVVASLHLASFWNFFLVTAVSWPLSLQAIWGIRLLERIDDQTRNFSLVAAIILGEIAWVLSFWPIAVSVFALLLTAVLYELVGIIQFHLGEKLNRRIANEFIIVAIVVFSLALVTTQWGA